MAINKSLSEAARWFLGHLEKTLADFGAREGVQIAVVDRDGEIVNDIYGIQKVCKLILVNEGGGIRCRDHFRSALPLVRSQKKTIFTECYAGFISIWTPIVARGIVVGVLVCCGGRQDKGESREKLEKKFSKLAGEIGFLQKNDFLRAAIDEVSIILGQDEIEARAGKIEELIKILVQSANTPLKEVLG